MKNRLEDFLKEVDSLKINEISKKYTFRASVSYYFRTLFFLSILCICLYTVYNRVSSKNYINIFLMTLLFVYILYSLYSLFSYKLIIENNLLVYSKEKINLNEIDSLKLVIRRIGGNKYDECLQIISKDKEYIIRLNITDRYKFVYLISKISKIKVSVG